MPRLSALRIGTLEDLAAQLRFAPRETLLRQVGRVQELAIEIDPALNYPEDWVVFRITGYRPEMESPATLVGAALLGDLSALSERLSEAARLEESEVGGALISIDGLCARWSVSRRTLERWRRFGLIGLRVRDARARARLVFPSAIVEEFEARSATLIGRGETLTRTTAADRTRMIRLAARCRRRYGWSLNETARRLAGRLERGQETVRRVLRRHDASSEERIFPPGGPLSARDRRVIWRAVRKGIDPALIARRFDRSRASVHRVANERRADRLRAISFPPAAGRRAAWTAEQIERALSHPLARRIDPIVVERTGAEFVALATAAPPLPAEQERALATAQRALIERARRMIADLPRRGPRAGDIDRIETDLRWVSALRAALVAAHRRVVIQSIEARMGRPFLELPAEGARTLHRLAMDAAIGATGSFEPSKGGRIAAPIGIAVNRALARSPAEDIPAGRAKRARHEIMPLDDWVVRVAAWRDWLLPDPRVRAQLDRIDQAPRGVVIARHGWALGVAARPLTVEETAQATGISPARVGVMERAALDQARRLAREARTAPE